MFMTRLGQCPSRTLVVDDLCTQNTCGIMGCFSTGALRLRVRVYV
jgi:hypothetical protein